MPASKNLHISRSHLPSFDAQPGDLRTLGVVPRLPFVTTKHYAKRWLVIIWPSLLSAQGNASLRASNARSLNDL